MMSDVTDKQQRAPDGNTDGIAYTILLQNVDLNNGSPLASAGFKLTSHLNVSVTCDEKGQATFGLTNTGRWTLEQTKAPSGYKLIPNPIIINFNGGIAEIEGDQESDWFDFDSASNTLTVKNSPIEPEPEPEPEPTKYVTNNSLAELIRLVKAQSSQVLNVTVNHTIGTYTPMEIPTNKKKFYADVPCPQSKTTMNVQISPNDSVENVGLLTYAEPMDGKVRVYFSEQPTESYIVDSIELTHVTSVISEHLIKRVSDIPINEKLKFSSGRTFIVKGKNITGHEANSVTLCSEYIIEDAEWGEVPSYSESNIHKTIMPKYYNELSELEKSAIICRNFNTYMSKTNRVANIGTPYIASPSIESYFYAPDITEADSRIYFHAENSDWGRSIVPDQYLAGKLLSSSRNKKTFKDGRAGAYYSTTTRLHDRSDTTSYLRVSCVAENGGEQAAEYDLYDNIDIERDLETTPDGFVVSVSPSPEDTPTFHTVTSGVVPFCDIKGDTLVMKDTDGYWVIVEAPATTTVNVTLECDNTLDKPDSLTIRLFKDGIPCTDESDPVATNSVGNISFENMDPTIDYEIKAYDSNGEFDWSNKKITKTNNLPDSIDYKITFYSNEMN